MAREEEGAKIEGEKKKGLVSIVKQVKQSKQTFHEVEAKVEDLERERESISKQSQK